MRPGIAGFIRAADGRVIHLVRDDVPEAPSIGCGGDAAEAEQAARRHERRLLRRWSIAGALVGLILGYLLRLLIR